MIRQADPHSADDFKIVRDLAHTFNDKHYGIHLNDDKLERWYAYMPQLGGVIYISDNGFIAGFPVADPVRDWTALVETSWYAEDRAGARLLRKFINYGRIIGADEVRMTTLTDTPAHAVALLQRWGFEEIERSHRLTP